MNNKGQTMVEFVLVIPVFLLIILFIMQLFFIMHSQQKLVMAESFIVNAKILDNPINRYNFYNEEDVRNYVQKNFFSKKDTISLNYDTPKIFGEDSIFNVLLICKQPYKYKDITFSLIQGIFKVVDGNIITQTKVRVNK